MKDRKGVNYSFIVMLTSKVFIIGQFKIELFVSLLYFKPKIKLNFLFRILFMTFDLFAISISGDRKFRTTRCLFLAGENRSAKIRLAFCGQSRLVSVKVFSDENIIKEVQ